MTRLLYLDTNILMYLLERQEPYSSRVATYLEEYTKGSDGQLASSAVAVTEFLAGSLSGTLDVLLSVPRLSFVELDHSMAAKAGMLQRQNSLPIGDAIHLATAILLKAEALFTNDKVFARVAEGYLPVRAV